MLWNRADSNIEPSAYNPSAAAPAAAKVTYCTWWPRPGWWKWCRLRATWCFCRWQCKCRPKWLGVQLKRKPTSHRHGCAEFSSQQTPSPSADCPVCVVEYVSGQQVCSTCGYEPLPVDESGRVKMQPNRRTRLLERRMRKLNEFGIFGDINTSLLSAITEEQGNSVAWSCGCPRTHFHWSIRDKGGQRQTPSRHQQGLHMCGRSLCLRCGEFAGSTQNTCPINSWRRCQCRTWSSPDKAGVLQSKWRSWCIPCWIPFFVDKGLGIHVQWDRVHQVRSAGPSSPFTFDVAWHYQGPFREHWKLPCPWSVKTSIENKTNPRLPKCANADEDAQRACEASSAQAEASSSSAAAFLGPEPPSPKASQSWSWNRDHYGSRREWSKWQGRWWYRDEASGRWVLWRQ